MPGNWRAAAAGLDSLTAACAALNLVYFLYRLGWRRQETASRIVAAFALALVSMGALGESLFFLASLTVLPAGSPPDALSWVLIRLLTLAGAAVISALVLRRLLDDCWPEETLG